jgi:hypothetical protein
MPKVTKLTHRTVRGIDLEWEEVANFPVGDFKIVWNPLRACPCGKTRFVITRAIRSVEIELEGGENEDRREEIHRIVCPDCIDYLREEIIIGELDYPTMTVSLYDRPREPTEDERRPGRWRERTMPAAVDPARNPTKSITAAEYLAWRAMMDDDIRRADEYRVKLAAWEKAERTKMVTAKPPRKAKVKPSELKGLV